MKQNFIKRHLAWCIGGSVRRMAISILVYSAIWYLIGLNVYSAFFNLYRSDTFLYTKSYGYPIYDVVNPGYRFKIVCDKGEEETYLYDIDKTIDHDVAYRGEERFELSDRCIKFLYNFEE